MKSGVLDASGSFRQENVTVGKEMTITLQSSSENRAIELSTNGGGFFFIPQYDEETEDGIAVVIAGPITDFRITGAEGDKWSYVL